MNNHKTPNHWTVQFRRFLDTHADEPQVAHIIKAEQDIRETSSDVIEVESRLLDYTMSELSNLDPSLLEALPEDLLYADRPFERVEVNVDAINDAVDGCSDDKHCGEAPVETPAGWSEQFVDFLKRRFGDAGIRRAVVIYDATREGLENRDFVNRDVELVDWADNIIEFEIVRMLMLEGANTPKPSNGDVSVTVMEELSASPTAAPGATVVDAPATVGESELQAGVEQSFRDSFTQEQFGREIEEAGVPRNTRPFNRDSIGHTEEERERARAAHVPQLSPEERLTRLERAVFPNMHPTVGMHAGPTFGGFRGPSWFEARPGNHPGYGGSYDRLTYGRLSERQSALLGTLRSLVENVESAIHQPMDDMKRYPFITEQYAQLANIVTQLRMSGLRSNHPYMSHIRNMSGRIELALERIAFLD